VNQTEQPAGLPARARRTRTQRFEALSDGVFAIAITLLVLDLAIPSTPHSARHLLDAVADEWPGYLGYLVSFSTIGAIWLGHNALTNYLDQADGTLLRLNLLLLLFVSFLPFPTRLLAEYATTGRAERVASTFYGLTLLMCVGLLSVLWRYAWHARLVRPDVHDEELSLLRSRLTPGLAALMVALFPAVVGPRAQPLPDCGDGLRCSLRRCGRDRLPGRPGVVRALLRPARGRHRPRARGDVAGHGSRLAVHRS
jgi:uncharacterized membrane protein